MKTWIQTYTGRQFDVFAPDPAQIDPIDIAWHLSMKCRYNGATTRFYSVAEHCCVLHDYFLARGDLHMARRALMHDANEAYLPDVPRPIKNGLTGWRELEARVDRAIFERFGLGWPMPEEVLAADGQIIRDERAQVCTKTDLGWAGTGVADPPALGVVLPGYSQFEAFTQFADRFGRLFGPATS